MSNKDDDDLEVVLDDEEAGGDEQEQEEDEPEVMSREEFKRKLEAQNKLVSQDSRKDERKKFLSELTDLFAHFMNNDAGEKKTPGTPRKGRHADRRKEEAEEDEEILHDEERAVDEEEVVVNVTQSPPFIAGGTMRSYQLDALNWMLNLYRSGANGILADEMGLGKTLETISLLGYMKNVMNLSGPHLVIVPNSTLANWRKEFHRWCPSIRAFVFHGDKEKRARQKARELLPGEFDVCVTSYEMVLRELTALSKFQWRYIVIDEAHRIKNEQSKLSESVRVLKSNNRLLLTGTPLQNNLHELWALLNFLMPDLFESSALFDEWFKQVEGKSGNSDAKQAAANNTVQQLHKILKPFLLRRVKADVETELLPKKEVKVFVGLTKQQKELYRKMLLKDLEAVNGALAGNTGKLRLLNIVMQLRKVCNHPYLFQGVEPGPPFVEGEHIVTTSGKMVVLDKLLRKLQANGSRVLIFSQMTRMLDIIEDYLDLRHYEYCRIDGSSAQEDREEQIDAFNAPGSSKFVFLLSTRAGGLGINLATADTVILYDSDWNPQMDLQAMDRAHRIGQKKQVMVYRLVNQDTVEQRIVERAEAKLYLDALVIQQGRLVEKHNATGNELLQMVKFGADTIFQGGDDDYQLTDADIDQIIALGKKKGDEFSEKLKASNLSLASFAESGVGSLYEHGGQDYAELHKEQKRRQLMTWIAPPKREAKVATYNEAATFGKMLGQKQKSKRNVVPTRPPKQPVIYPFQFFPAKITQLFEKETANFLAEYQVKALQEKIAAASQKENNEKELEPLRAELEAAQANVPPPLSEDEERQKERLLAQGFLNWKPKDFQAFVRGLELYGRDDIEAIAQEVGFPVDDVREYHKVFFKNCTSLPDWDKITVRIERGEAKREKERDMIALLKTMFVGYKDPWTEMDPADVLPATNNRDWIPQNDFWLLVNAHRVGFGNWETLRLRVVTEPRFALDWFMLSRTAEDLHERVDRLLRLMQERQKRKAQRAEGGGAGSPDAAVVKPKKAAATAKKRERGSAAADAAAGSGGEELEDEPKSAGKRKKGKHEPKGARSAYALFSSERRVELKQQNESVSFGELSKLVSEEWKALSAEQRKKYDDMALEDHKRYEEELQKWKEEFPDEAAAEQEAAASAPKRSGGKRGALHSSERDPPKHAHSAYQIFSTEMRSAVKTKNPGSTSAQVTALLAAEWKAATPDVRKKFEALAKRELDEYTKAFDAWKKKYPEEFRKLEAEKKQKKEESKKKRTDKKIAEIKSVMKGTKREEREKDEGGKKKNNKEEKDQKEDAAAEGNKKRKNE